MDRTHAFESSKRAIDRRAFLKVSGAGAVAMFGGGIAGNAGAALQTGAPNILVIITDQQTIDTISAAGCPYINTPAMDRLTRRGMSFAESYSPNPVCSPARSVIFSGRTSSETGVYVNGRPIRSDIPNLGQWFTQNTNYETVYSGKWHVPAGFTHFIPGFRVLHAGISGQGNLGDTGASRACEGFLHNRSPERPFLLVASFLQPHDICEWLRINMNNPGKLRYPELADRLPPLPDNFEFDRREPAYMIEQRNRCEPAEGGWDERQWRYYIWSYYRHVEMVDGEIGRVLDALDKTGYASNTLIVFTSDHGEGLGRHQKVRKSCPYDEISKVPLLVSLPGKVLENKIDKTHLVTSLEIMPTLCDYAGIKPPKNMRGKSLRPVLEGKQTDWHDYIVTEMPSNRARLVRSERYKYINYNEDPVDLLFDMKNDPGETRNLAADPAYAEVVKEHKKMLQEWELKLETAPSVPNADAWRNLV
jgi:arylsulfatase A-like enzyme